MCAPIKCSMGKTGADFCRGRTETYYVFICDFLQYKHGERKEENEVEEEKEIYRRGGEEKEREIVKDSSEVGMRVHEIRFRFRGH